MPAESPLARVLDRRASALGRHLPAALAGDPAGVHQARVASRRLREALPVLAAAGLDRAAARALRPVRLVTRMLGPVRELDVALGVLATHVAAHPEERAEGEVVRAWLERQRAGRREAMAEGLDECRLARMWSRLGRIGRRLRAVEAHADASWRRALGKRLQVRARLLADEIARTGMLYAPEPLHAVRIACKKLRYAVELTGDLWPSRRTEPIERTLKAQQDLLGRIHDLEILTAFADRACAELESPRRVSAARLAGDWHRECRERHAKYLRARPGLAQAGDAALALGRRLVHSANQQDRREVGATRPGAGR